MTDAEIHDSQVFEDVIDPLVRDRAVYAESGYRSAAREASLAGAGIASRIHVRAHVNVPLSDASKAANHEESSVSRSNRVHFWFPSYEYESRRLRTYHRQPTRAGHHRPGDLTYNLSRYM